MSPSSIIQLELIPALQVSVIFDVCLLFIMILFSYFQSNTRPKEMKCTMAKCWPNTLSTPCFGPLRLLSEFSSSPDPFLQQTSSSSRFHDNPKHTWQVWMSKVTGSQFSEEEISNFYICKTHQVLHKSNPFFPLFYVLGSL